LTDAEAKRSYAGKQSSKKPISEWAFIQLNKIEASHLQSKFASRITTGNTTDDMAKIANVDWIIEVVVERLDIKNWFWTNWKI
jgi:3-hydroxyacyl-CoA dehydrogenase